MRLGRSFLLGLVAFSSISLIASATPVTGEANIGDGVTVTATTIDFNVGQQFNVSGTNTGSFAGLTGGTFNQVLTGGPVTGPLPTPIADFITFNTASGVIDFDLTGIEPGAGNNANCMSGSGMCTPTGSPFTLSQIGNGVSVTLTLDGTYYYTSSPTDKFMGQGLFTTQIIPGTVGGLLAELSSPTGRINQSYSATFDVTSVPEPASLLLMGAGLLGCGLIARRKTQKS